jgi:hypothetical protein
MGFLLDCESPFARRNVAGRVTDKEYYSKSPLFRQPRTYFALKSLVSDEECADIEIISFCNKVFIAPLALREISAGSSPKIPIEIDLKILCK